MLMITIQTLHTCKAYSTPDIPMLESPHCPPSHTKPTGQQRRGQHSGWPVACRDGYTSASARLVHVELWTKQIEFVELRLLHSTQKNAIAHDKVSVFPSQCFLHADLMCFNGAFYQKIHTLSSDRSDPACSATVSLCKLRALRRLYTPTQHANQWKETLNAMARRRWTHSWDPLMAGSASATHQRWQTWILEVTCSAADLHHHCPKGNT